MNAPWKWWVFTQVLFGCRAIQFGGCCLMPVKQSVKKSNDHYE